MYEVQGQEKGHELSFLAYTIEGSEQHCEPESQENEIEYGSMDLICLMLQRRRVQNWKSWIALEMSQNSFFHNLSWDNSLG